MDQPLFSVIIPCFRDHGFARGAVRSCINQLDVAGLEVVVVDDGSEERDYLAFAESLSGVAGVKVFWQPNAGPSAARNRGVKESTGQYLLFLDSDDEIGPSYLSTVHRIILGEKAGPRSVILSPFSYFANPGERVSSLMAYFRAPRLMSWPWFDRFCMLTGNCFPISSCVISREVYDEVAGFDERLTHHEDWDLWIRIIEAGTRVCYTDGGYADATYVRMRQGHMSNTKAMRSSQREVIARHATGVASVLSFRTGWTILRLARWILILVQLALGYPDQHARPGRTRR
jgi:glycosyltransferase involved in cell wall biosynthesis